MVPVEQGRINSLLMEVRLEISESETEVLFTKRSFRLSASVDIKIKLPFTTERMTLKIRSTHPKALKIETLKFLHDVECPLELTDRDRKFIAFVKWFALENKRLEAGEKGTIYQSEGFRILFLDEIKEGETELSTPARVERLSGIIELSKAKISEYTVPMIVLMLLHEYAHKYKNPEFGKDIQNELTADIIAVNIALNLGFDSIDIIQCFREVFSSKKTKLNEKRMQAIQEFISLYKQKSSKK